MNHRACSLLLSVVLIASALVGGENPQVLPRNKGNVRYSVRPNYSRFFLLFRGPVQYNEHLQGKTLTLTVNGITSAPSDLGANLQFKEGLIERAFVARIANASSKVVLTLRDGFGTYTIGRMDGLEALIIDIIPGGAIAQTRPPLVPVARQTRPKKESSSANTAAGQTAIIDIAALAKKQLEEPEVPKNPPASRPEALTVPKPQLQAPTKESGSATNTVVWLVVLLVSTIVTVAALAGLIFLALRRKVSRSISGQEQALRNSLLRNQTELEEYQAAEAVRAERSALSGVADSEESEPFEERHGVRALQIAEQYRRSQGEVELAVKLREQAGSNEQARRIKTIKATGLPHRGKLMSAKKLGVGKGELDLASKLRRLKEAFSTEEEKV